MKTGKQGVEDHQRSRQEIKDCVTFVRLELYNSDRPCGPKAVRERPAHVRERLHAYCQAAA